MNTLRSEEPFNVLLGQEFRAASLSSNQGRITTKPAGTTAIGLSTTNSRTPLQVRGLSNTLMVVLARLFSNSTPSTLTRALHAYHNADGTQSAFGHAFRDLPKRAKVLTPGQTETLIKRYRGGATVYELGKEFEVHRTTVAEHLKRAGLSLRMQPPTQAVVNQMVELYESGLSLCKVGKLLGFDPETVRRYVRGRGVPMRSAHAKTVDAHYRFPSH